MSNKTPDSAYYESDKWKALWKDLTKYSDKDSTVEIKYTVRETSGFRPYVNQNPHGVQSGGTITNKISAHNLKIVKTGQEDHDKKLGGAEFTMHSIISDTAPGNEIKYIDGDPVVKTTAAETGEALFDGLSPGYYEIKETKTPEGYVTTGTDCFYIRVNKDGVSLIQPDLSKPAEQWTVIGSSDMVYTFTAAQGKTPATAYVGNTPGAELPHTGGIGTSHLYLTGGLMTLAAGLILYLKRK